jgi:hypothetical protein
VIRWAILTGEYPPQPGGTDHVALQAWALVDVGHDSRAWRTVDVAGIVVRPEGVIPSSRAPVRTGRWLDWSGSSTDSLNPG